MHVCAHSRARTCASMCSQRGSRQYATALAVHLPFIPFSLFLFFLKPKMNDELLIVSVATKPPTTSPSIWKGPKMRCFALVRGCERRGRGAQALYDYQGENKGTFRHNSPQTDSGSRYAPGRPSAGVPWAQRSPPPEAPTVRCAPLRATPTVAGPGVVGPSGSLVCAVRLRERDWDRCHTGTRFVWPPAPAVLLQC